MFARDGFGDPFSLITLELARPNVDPVMTWAEGPHLSPFAKLYELDEDAYRLWIDSVGCFEVQPRSARVTLPREGDPRVEARLWGLPAALCFMERGDLPIHAAAVEVDGVSVLVAAPGRHGKTTLAASLLGAGHRVLSEDLSCCRVAAGAASVLPGPALLRVRRDSYERLDIPVGDVVAEDPDRVYLRLTDWARGSARGVPIAGIVLLREDENEVWWERVDKPDAIRDLWALSFRLPGHDSHLRSFRGVSDLGSVVPVWNLHRPLRYERLDDTVDAVVKIAGGG